MTSLPHYHPSSTDEDLLPVVDEHDRVTGSAPRREVHECGLRHRAVHIVVRNGMGELLLQERGRGKDSYPGWWDVSVGGHVDAGEDYNDAAVREAGEELGIARAPVTEVARRPPSGVSGNEFIRIYDCLYDGPLAPPPGEIESVRWVRVEELLHEARPDHPEPRWRITPSGLESIRLWAAAMKERGAWPC